MVGYPSNSLAFYIHCLHSLSTSSLLLWSIVAAFVISLWLVVRCPLWFIMVRCDRYSYWYFSCRGTTSKR